MAQPNSKHSVNQSFELGVSHARSLSQPTFFGNNCLPPLSPFPRNDTSNSSFKDVSMEEMDVSSRGPPLTPPYARKNVFRGSENLPPRKGHRRSNSDVPLGFSAVIQSSPQLVPISGQGSLGRTAYTTENLGNLRPIGVKRPESDTVSDGKSYPEGMIERRSEGEVVDDLVGSLMNLDHMGALNMAGSVDKDRDSVASGSKISGDDSSNTETESVSRHGTSSREGIKRSAAGDIAPPPRHYRSLSMDSAIGNMHFGEESPNLSASFGKHAGQLSPSNSLSENSGKLNLEFGQGEFNEAEMKKIMADERLAEIAISDPKRVKRILANRQSAARSKERKLRYISELEHKVQTLQTEATTLSAQLTILQKDYTALASQNSELKFRVQAMEQQAQLRDALHEALTAEVQRLKLANMELREEGRTPNGMAQQQVPSKHHMFQVQHQQPNQHQRLSVTTSTTSTSASTAPASA